MNDSDQTMTIYGMRGFTHGWGRTLSLTADTDATSLAARIDCGEDARVEVTDNGIVRLTEARAGGLDRIIQRHDIQVVSRESWQRRRTAQ
jgi:hypothetical protein